MFENIRNRIRFLFYDTFGERHIERFYIGHGDYIETCGWIFRNKFIACDKE
jgi:hypothetical protein